MATSKKNIKNAKVAAKKVAAKPVAKKSTTKTAKAKTTKTDTGKVLRFSHPFFTNVPVEERAAIPKVGKRMNDYVASKLEPFPDPWRDPSMTLAEVIGDAGAAEIAQAQVIKFQAVGDTGNEKSDWASHVSDAMALDYDPAAPATSAAFLLHLGDVDYYDNTDQGYHAQFYEPYKKYPGKIIAIPGNHDGELFKWNNAPTGQKTSLEAFVKNFCQKKPGVPSAAGTIYREMVAQPGVYWILDTPFVSIIGLYSNIAEGQGFIADKSIGQSQKQWLVKALASVKKDRDSGKGKALIIAVHHPPFSNGGHEPSTAMLNDIDDACTKANIYPDALMAAHAHSYQAYTRFINGMEIPFTVNGCGGRGLQPPKPADGTQIGEVRYDKSYNGYGFQTITATKNELTLEFYSVDETSNRQLLHKIVVDLKTHKLK